MNAETELISNMSKMHLIPIKSASVDLVAPFMLSILVESFVQAKVRLTKLLRSTSSNDLVGMALYVNEQQNVIFDPKSTCYLARSQDGDDPEILLQF